MIRVETIEAVDAESEQAEVIAPERWPQITERFRIALLSAIAVLVYANTLGNGFTLDDDLYISLNPQVTHTSLRALLTPHTFSAVFRPVTSATFALNWALGGAQPLGFHMLNLLLHAAVTCLFYLLLRTILREAMPRLTTVPFIAALLFAVHPIHTEAVASIAGRAELLAAAFLLAACFMHVADREIPALACFVLAVLSKESAVVFLPLVLVCDYARGEWKPLFRYARIAGVTALYLGVLWTIQGGRFGPAGVSQLDNPLAQLPASWRILNALRVAWKYVGLQIFPRMLSCDYSFNQILIYLDWRHTLPAAAAAAAAVTAWSWAVRKHQPGLIMAGGIYLAGFATTANILMPIGTIMGERLAYFPSAGFCLLVALAWAWMFGSSADFETVRPKNIWQRTALQRNLALAVMAVVVAAFGVRTVIRNFDWKNNRTLISSAVNAAPRSAKMHANLASIYLGDGQLGSARTEFQFALAINPNYPDALEAYGLLESRLGNYQAAGSMLEKAFYSSQRNNPNYDFMAVNLAAAYIQAGHLDGALQLLDREIAESPQYAPAWSSRAVVHYKRGEKSEAARDADMALHLTPEDAQAIEVKRLLNR